MTLAADRPAATPAPRARRGHEPPRGARGDVRPVAGDVRRDPLEHGRHDRAAADHRRPRRQPVLLHLGRRPRRCSRSTVTTPIWGKLSDLFDRKLLVQTGLVIYVSGSILAGLSQSTSWLIACRVLQGIGVGGLTALVQVILSDLVSPRERGRYAGYLGAVFGIGTVAGPLIGGVVTDGARLALVLLHRHPVRDRRLHHPAAHAAPPAPPPRDEDRLRRRDADRGRREQPADLGLARRPGVRLALVADGRDGHSAGSPSAPPRSSSSAGCPSRSSRCGCSPTAASCSP